MINTNTVFILGAGASKPYGFPTGGELTEKILSYNVEKAILEANKESTRTRSWKYIFRRLGPDRIRAFIAELN